MITLDTSLIFNTMYYELNTKRTNTNAYESIDSYTEAHAAKGTPEFVKNKDLDQDTIIKALKLHLPRNRLSILNLLNHSELVQLLYLLDKGKMVLGLKFFTKPKLLQYIYDLPKEEILKILFQVYSKDELLSFMPMKALMGFLGSTKIQHGDLMKVIKSMPKHLLAQILESITGKPVENMTIDEMIKKLGKCKQEALVEGLRSLPYKELLQVVSKLTEMNNDLFLEFSKNSLIDPISRLGKSSIVESMQVLNPELIVKLLDELPNNLLAVINTMIDQDKLTEVLQKYHSDLLASLVE
ncbi:MAG: hypothetical protein A2287_10185 [Candidatus Melainabacteria bacterium RIFOXYA12_FULL_32_12]|nr:MAG: hypothetical protein A2255_02340 [Candidatus Melainabacteria bacterium RIFOXYA2_FULL_32_9]OGI25488.1 MAG: hypothetical protein A2287_10185 [Candidatus Melainabacteria bacterium RIFOXYA12_FULL_32_12]